MQSHIKPMIVAGLALALTGCASTGRLMSYTDGQMTSDGTIGVDGRAMSLYAHPTDDALLVQKSVGDATVSGALQGATFGLARGWQPDPRKVDAALSAFVRPAGCSVSPVVPVGDTAFEGRYSCPAGVNLRAMMATQRNALRRGEPLRP